MGPSRKSFLYPTAHSNSSTSTLFDPKAYTRASYEPKPVRPQQQGPLISFNRHPDSWETPSYDQIGGQAPHIHGAKHGVRWTRKVQLLLRILECLGAAGLLAMVIMLRRIEDQDVWLLRAPPGIAIIHCLYGIYHLFRPVTGRTPATQYSYSLFSSISDACLLPFYAWTMLLARQQYRLFPNKSQTWTTVFNSPAKDLKVVQSLWLASMVLTGLHGISLITGIYHALIFRKISRLPPDMNPLEADLTWAEKQALRKNGQVMGHSKAKDSQSTLVDEKHLSTFNISSIPDVAKAAQPAPTMPFAQTRSNGSSENLARMNRPYNDHRGSYPTTPTRAGRGSPMATPHGRDGLPSQRRGHHGGHTPQHSVTDLRRSRARDEILNSALPHPNHGSIFNDVPFSPSRSPYGHSHSRTRSEVDRNSTIVRPRDNRNSMHQNYGHPMHQQNRHSLPQDRRNSIHHDHHPVIHQDTPSAPNTPTQSPKKTAFDYASEQESYFVPLPPFTNATLPSAKSYQRLIASHSDDENDDAAPSPVIPLKNPRRNSGYAIMSEQESPVPSPLVVKRPRSVASPAIPSPAASSVPSPTPSPAPIRVDESVSPSKMRGKKSYRLNDTEERPVSAGIPNPLAANPAAKSPAMKGRKSMGKGGRGGLAEIDGNNAGGNKYESLNAVNQPIILRGGVGRVDEYPGDGARKVSGRAAEEGRGNGWARLRKVSGLKYLS